MTEEQIKAKAKEQFPNDEFKQQIVIDAIIWATKELEKENTELKEQISTKDILIEELQEQKVYWKESSFDWRHKFFKLDKVKRLIKKDKQLSKAKEIIREFVEWANWQGNSKCPSFRSIQDKAEQFLKE